MGRLFPVFLIACVLFAGACEVTPDARRTSIYELRANPTEDNVRRIRAYLSDPDRDVRATALNVLVGLEVEDSVELALAALRDEDGFVRATAAKLLGDTGDPRHAGVLAESLLEDPDSIVRQRAAEALAKVGGPEAVDALAQGIADPMDNVRLASVEGLTVLDPAAAIEGLARILHEDGVWEVRAQAARALGRSADPAAIPALESALDDENEFVRSAAANAIHVNRTLRGEGGGGDS